MRLEKGKISGSLLVFLILGFIFGDSMVLPPGGTAKHDAWIAIFLGLVEASFFALVFIALAGRFPGKTLVQISDAVYGRYLGKLVSAFFLWYLFHLNSVIIIDISYFFNTMIMPETPFIVFSIMIMLVSIWAARNGIEVIARCSQVLVPLTMLTVLVTILVLIKDMDIKNFQPVLEVPASNLLYAVHRTATFPFGEIVVFLMVFPFLNNTREAPMSVFKALVIAGLFLMFISIRNTGMLGEVAGIQTYPSFETLRLINVLDVFTRLEVIVSINYLFMGFIVVSVLLYSVSLGTAQLLSLRSYVPMVIPIGILMIIPMNYKNIAVTYEFANRIYPIYALPFELGIPLVTLIIAVLRKLPGRDSR